MMEVLSNVEHKGTNFYVKSIRRILIWWYHNKVKKYEILKLNLKRNHLKKMKGTLIQHLAKT